MNWFLILQASEEKVDEQLQKAVSFVDKLVPQLLQLGKLILIAIIVFFIGKKIIQVLLKFVKRFFERSSIEQGVAGFLTAFVKVILNIILAVVIVGIFGIQTSSIAALVGSAGLTLGLAFQGSLSNFAGGFLILLMKPFRIGDYIIVFNEEGTVTSIDIFYTRLLTVDNRMIVLPNGALSNANITNVTNEPIRRLDLTVSVDYSESIEKVKNILFSITGKEEMILHDREIQVFVSSFDPSAITVGVRVWVQTDQYWPLRWKILEDIKKAFDENNITIPYDQLDVNLNQK